MLFYLIIYYFAINIFRPGVLFPSGRLTLFYQKISTNNHKILICTRINDWRLTMKTIIHALKEMTAAQYMVYWKN